MSVKVSTKQFYIDLFRKNGFNCFAIPIYPDETPNQQKKAGDKRYKAQGQTKPNQIISENENYAILPTKEGRNCIVDLDDKKKYRTFAKNMIKEGYMVIETPNGWHIPVINLGNFATKIELYDFSVQKTKIIEIQGWLHYVIGVGSSIVDKETKKILKYVNKGTDKIWNARGIPFDDFVDSICQNCEVEFPKENNSSYKHLRDQFSKGKTPTEKQSNNFYHESARQCLHDELTRDEAIDKIKENYENWKLSDNFSGRSWNNVEYKINEVYDNPDKFKIKVGHPKGGNSDIDRTKIAKTLIEDREFYSNKETHEVFENKSGFLEKINHTLKVELIEQYGELEKPDYDSILFKMESLAEDYPKTNKDLIVFQNGVYDITKHCLVDTDEIADMGFRNYRYLKPTKANEPKQFMNFFKDYSKHEHSRIKMGLRSIFSGHLDSRISTIIGKNRVGKTSIVNIVKESMGNEYAMSVELDVFLKDRATQSKIKGKRLVIFQDLSDIWEDFARLKVLTGESSLMIREFGKEADQNPNKVKFFITGNQIPSIKKSQKDSMYSARLSLIHNTRTEKYEEDERFEDRIIEAEAEKIISWIINLPDSECKYEDSATVRMEWEKSANPEVEWLKEHYEDSTNFDDKMTVKRLVDEFREFSGIDRDNEMFAESMRPLGYVIHYGVIKNIVTRTKPTMKLEQ